MKLCQPGYYSIDGKGYCTVCPAASYCSKQDVAPVACPSGWWADIG